MPAGRPSEYSQETAVLICARIAGGESLKSVCADESMPGRSSVYEWFISHPEFSDMYARAKEDSADVDAEEIKEIADDVTADPNCRRVRIDARKWTASKLKPKKYGERIEHTGEVTLSLSDRMRDVLGTPKT